ncbi:MAG: ABC transporter substrate-binding protein [Chlamydiales bacterium]|nr:ABC transporter substrate-binding protein [Chlamydiales bacterium]
MMKVLLLNFLRNYTQTSSRIVFLTSLSLNFSTIYSHMLSKLINKSTQKISIFPSKANYARCLLLICILGFCACTSPDLEEGTYRIARDPSWYPMTLMGKEPGVLGFSDDLVRAIAEEEGLSVTLYLTSSSSLEYGLSAGNWDAILGSIPPVVGYNQIYSFSSPYLSLGPVLVVPIDADVVSIGDLSGQEVGILAGSSSITLLEQNPAIIIRTYNSIPAALEDLVVAQNINAVLMPALPAYGYVRDIYYGQLKVAGKPLNNIGLRLITLIDQEPKLIKRFNEGLQKLQENGKYDALLAKWHLK